MFGKTHTKRRLALGLALLAAVAAPVAAQAAGPTQPSGFVTDAVSSAPRAASAYAVDPWLATAIAAHHRTGGTAYTLPAGFVTDAVSSGPVPLPRRPRPYTLPAGFITDAVSSGPVAAASTSTSGGFDWPSFGIGLGAGAGGLLLVGAGLTRVTPRRRLANA